MLISAYRLLEQIPATLLPRVLSVFSSMALGVCEGQQYDMDFESKQKVSVVEYMSMIELKTSVLVAGSAMIGAILGGANEEQSRSLYRFAIELGMAFQLQDDLLDSYGGTELGKKIGGDILEGKQTYLMVAAMSHADETQREILRHTHQETNLSDEEKIATVKRVYDELGIPKQTEHQIASRFDKALSLLNSLDVPDIRKEALRAFAKGLMNRRK
jgi:geranylgeranyl diphosphate synthase type II